LSEPPTPLQTLSPELVSQLHDVLPRSLFEQLNGSLHLDQQRLSLTEERLRFVEYKVRVLEERLRLLRVHKYGPSSERLSDAQLELLEAEPGVSAAEVCAESQREPIATPPAAKPTRPHPGRQELPAELPRVEQVIACPPAQCVCGQCGRPTVVIGYEQSEQLDVEPAQYFVRVLKREKRACKACEERGVTCAPLPERIIEKGLASDRVVIDTVVRKYADFLPLYRQSVILERETGLQISRATLDGWVMQVGELLRPIVGAMRQDLLGGSYLQADETPVGVQLHDGRGKNHQAYLWQYGHPRGSVVFDFRLGRERDGPKRFLADFAGVLQSDGYGAYDQVGGHGIVHAACWAHARRKFVDAVKLNPTDQSAIRLVAQMDALFAIDAQARQGGLSQEARCVTQECTGQGVPLHADALGSAHLLPGLSRVRIEQQRGRKLDASGRAGTPQLDPYRQQRSGAAGGQHPLDRRNLPALGPAGARLPHLGAAGSGQLPRPAHRGTHPSGLGRSKVVAQAGCSRQPCGSPDAPSADRSR
jgi:transposase